MKTKPKYSRTVLQNAYSREAQIKRAIEDGLSREQTANLLQISQSSLTNYLRVLKLHIPRPSSDNQPQSKIKDADIPKVLEMRKSGKTLAEIGNHFGVTSERIRQILSKNFPDVAIAKRAPSGKKCAVCGREHFNSGDYCSKECSGLARHRNRWDRDMFVVIMGLRNKGHTWAEIEKRFCVENSFSWQTKMRREAQIVLTTDERRKYFPKKCDSSQETDSSHLELTKENDTPKPQRGGFLGLRKTLPGFAKSWFN